MPLATLGKGATLGHCALQHTTITTTMTSREGVEQLVQELFSLAPRLPASIPEGSRTDKLYLTISTVSGGDAWETFNRRFDILFGEDCRNTDGHFSHLRRGKYGLDMVVSYLKELLLSAQAERLPYDLMHIKIHRLVEETKSLVEPP